QHLLHQATEWHDPSLRLAPSHDVATADIPCRQILPGPTPSILGFDAGGLARLAGQRRGGGGSGPGGRLLVGAEDVVSWPQGLTLPGARVKIQDRPGFLDEVRVAREDPVLVLPGLD